MKASIPKIGFSSLTVIPATLLLLGLTLLFPFLEKARADEWEDGQAATIVIGQSDFTSRTVERTANGFDTPSGIAIDPTTGKVFVAEYGNQRVLRFASVQSWTSGMAAEGVLGQATFTTSDGSGGPSRFWPTGGITVDSSGTLWVCDLNHRVLRFDNAATKSNGANADGVLGQPDFNSSTGGNGADEMTSPTALVADANGTLWVADSGNHRVIRFDDAANKLNGAAADGLLGWDSFAAGWDGTSGPNRMRNPKGLALHPNGTLYIADSGLHRITSFTNAANKADGANFDGILGNTSGGGLSGFTSTEFNDPHGLAIGGNDLWIADRANRRVLRYQNIVSKGNGSAADNVIGSSMFDFQTESVDPPTNKNLWSPQGVAVGPNGELLIVSSTQNRVLVFQPKRFQPDLTIDGKGANLYNASATGQKKGYRISGRATKRVRCVVQNDGNTDDRIVLKGRSTTSRFRIRHFRLSGGRTNVTGAVRIGTHRTTVLAPNARAHYQIEAAPRNRRRPAGIAAWLRGTSETSTVYKVDRVMAIIRYRP